MSEEVTSSVGPKPKASGTGVPGAIVVAGVLIALAIFFSNRAPAGMSSGDNVSAQPTPAAPIIAAMRPVDETDHVRGPADAKITIIEYSDLECPFCERFHPTMEQLIKEYPNDVRWVYRHFPLAIHPGARAKSHAAECAAEQGLFWEFTDTLFKAGTSTPVANLAVIAEQAGITDIAAWQICLDEERYADDIAADEQDAQISGGRGTPYSVVIGPNDATKTINGALPYETVKATVDSLL